MDAALLLFRHASHIFSNKKQLRKTELFSSRNIGT
jgi:hypothetical protein